MEINNWFIKTITNSYQDDIQILTNRALQQELSKEKIHGKSTKEYIDGTH